MLLRTRSILAQAIVLGLITLAKSQNHDSDYNVEEGSEDQSRYTGEVHEHPDYSKYYAIASADPQSGAQIQGKVDIDLDAPIEFSTFFGTPHFAFGASNNEEVLKPVVADPKKAETINGFVTDKDFKAGFSEYDTDGFGVQDYFEQAQKQQKAEESEEEELVEGKPGPSYISHRLPAKKSGNYEAEVEILRTKPSGYENDRSKNSEAEEDDEAVDEPSAPLNLAQFQSNNPSKILEETVDILRQSPNYYQKFEEIPTKTTTPYQKYSFQPLASSYGLKDPSILAAFNPSYAKIASQSASNYEFQPSEPVSQNIMGKECFKVNREVSDKGAKFNKQPMNCFICKDPKSGAKFEQCSYTNEPKPKAYYTSTSKSFGNPEKYRSKRDESESYSDPYEEIKSKSHDYYSRPVDFEKDFYKAPDFSHIKEYSFTPEQNEKEAEEKSYSEIQSQELLKKGDSCQKSHKDGVTCTVCKDAKTGANYEQCSYESAPNEKKYAYVKESKYDGDGNPIEEKVTGSTEPQPVVNDDAQQLTPSQRNDKADDSGDEAEEIKVNEEQTKEQSKNSKLVSDSPYDVPRHFAETTYKQQKAGVRGLDPALYGSSKSSGTSDNGPQKFTNLDEYHLKLFPRFSNEESRREEARSQPEESYFEDLSGKKDVEKVLEEFTKKDRSNCKQIQKKGMTCYLCVDKKGIQQEECMFVSESRPQKTHLAYHEVQHLKVPEKTAASEPAGKIIPEETSASEIQKRKKFFKKAVSPAAADSEANASTNVETRVKFTPPVAASENVYKTKRYADSKNGKAKKEAEVIKEPQPQFDINDEGGLYSAETQPIYSKVLGLSLPRYMLEISDMEREFDKSVSEYH